jgi:DNA-binding NarL/FixJ family response regulator
MDIRMPTMSGIEAVKALQAAHVDIPVIMLTTFDDHQLVMQAIQAGAKGYLLKDVSLETLVAGIKTVHEGKTLIQPAITERILQGLPGLHQDFPSACTPESLSDKELEILRLMAAGLSNREISEAMYMSEGTVKNQVSNILAKLGVRDRTRAVLKAIESGLL